jgi:hypothetical protein
MILNDITVTNSANDNASNSVKQSDLTNKSSKSQASNQSATTKTSTSNNTSADINAEKQAAVYEKSNENKSKKIYTQDTATIAQLKADSDRRAQQLRNLVEKMLLKQGETLKESDMYQLLREGKVPVDAETAAQAKQDISEDGYWGISQTSDRLVSFAKALTGGDPSKADEMIEAVKKGFDQATKAWGGDLPEISQKTLDTTLQKLNDWKDSAE